MIHTFTEKLFKQGNRYFIKIPFNIWEECSQKGEQKNHFALYHKGKYYDTMDINMDKVIGYLRIK